MLIDIPGLSSINRTYSKRAGDDVLHELTFVVRTALSSLDSIGHWSDERLLAILPETSARGAVELADRLQAVIAAHLFAVGAGVRLPCNIGVATYPNDAQTLNDIVTFAECALDASVRQGPGVAHALPSRPSQTRVATSTYDAGSDNAGLAEMVEAMATLLEARDSYTGEHVDDVADLALQMSSALGVDPIEARIISLAARVHDIGKVAIPDAILHKPGPLSDAEWAMMRRHPVVGADVVGQVPALRPLVKSIRGHHEKWNGRGYPDGLIAEGIPLGARVIAVADAYGAITTDRPYRRAHSSGWAVDELRRCAGSQFDTTVVGALERVLAGER